MLNKKEKLFGEKIFFTPLVSIDALIYSYKKERIRNMELFNRIGLDAGYVIIGLAGFSLLLLILIIVLFCKNSNLRKRYETFMKDSNAESLEKVFAKKFSDVEGLVKKTGIIDERLKKIDTTLLSTYQKMGIVKYDAFKEMGGKLSFALALLNDYNDGFIINAMHSTREGCYTYVKEIIKGECSVILAEEEKQALEVAMNSK